MSAVNIEWSDQIQYPDPATQTHVEVSLHGVAQVLGVWPQAEDWVRSILKSIASDTLQRAGRPARELPALAPDLARAIHEQAHAYIQQHNMGVQSVGTLTLAPKLPEPVPEPVAAAPVAAPVPQVAAAPVPQVAAPAPEVVLADVFRQTLSTEGFPSEHISAFAQTLADELVRSGKIHRG